jgi:arginyl-tRNA synthetase
LLNYFQEVLPKWTLRQKALVIEHAFSSELSNAKDGEARHYILQQRDFEASECWNALAEIRSRELVRQAQKLYIATDDLEWETDSYANRYLLNATQAKLRRAIVDERRKIWEFRLKVIGALTGLLGAAIGLLAFLERFFPRIHGR